MTETTDLKRSARAARNPPLPGRRDQEKLPSRRVVCDEHINAKVVRELDHESKCFQCGSPVRAVIDTGQPATPADEMRAAKAKLPFDSPKQEPTVKEANGGVVSLSIDCMSGRLLFCLLAYYNAEGYSF